MTDELELVPCKYCGEIPNTTRVEGDIYYTQCCCGKWNPYEFMGATKLSSKKAWNFYNGKEASRNKNDLLW